MFAEPNIATSEVLSFSVVEMGDKYKKPDNNELRDAVSWICKAHNWDRRKIVQIGDVQISLEPQIV